MDVIDTLTCTYHAPNGEGVVTSDLPRISDTVYQNESIDLGTMQVTAGPAPLRARDFINDAEGLQGAANGNDGITTPSTDERDTASVASSSTARNKGVT